MSYIRDISEVLFFLKKAKKEKIKINLLIGAGCSVTGNIPLAGGIVDIISKKFPLEYQRTKEKDYGSIMSLLTPRERRTLIYELVNKSKVNWAHLGIAQLIKSNYINRVLTTNFDNLISRACSLIGEYPGVYDLTTSDNFRSDHLFDNSIIHLHGQHTGFVLCNTQSEVNEQLSKLEPVFNQLNSNSMWIIVGYSGENDPIFKWLTEQRIFENRLFWIGYKDNEPKERLRKELLSEGKYAFYVNGFDADTFFIKLAQELKSFPPNFVTNPFSYMSSIIDNLSEFPSSNLSIGYKQFDSVPNNIQLSSKRLIDKALEQFENNKVTLAEHYLMAGLYDKVISIDSSASLEGHSEIEELKIQAIFSKAIESFDTNIIKDAISKTQEYIRINTTNERYYIMNNNLNLRLYKLENDILHLKQSIKSLFKACEIIPRDEILGMLGLQIIVYFQSNKIDILKGNKETLDNELLEDLKKYKENIIPFLIGVSLQKDKLSLLVLEYLIYLLIKNDFTDLAYNLLKGMYKVKPYLSNEHIAYFHANLGFYYFRHHDDSKNELLQNASDNYEKALEIFKEGSLENKYNKCIQKYYYEKALFFYKYNINRKEIAFFLSEAIDIGNIDEELYDDITELKLLYTK
ncbi:SIR2 family protein [Peribacillus frigoritolerans]|uniref:SIR2 family protein n=1 Tax=Peribacillus frigoritolerans TaxID=450367 RepID=UPI003CFDF7BA